MSVQRQRFVRRSLHRLVEATDEALSGRRHVDPHANPLRTIEAAVHLEGSNPFSRSDTCEYVREEVALGNVGERSAAVEPSVRFVKWLCMTVKASSRSFEMKCR